ncbi:MAG: hypothetical protein BYD32DRAFT_360435, partial [Podila humilis]
IPVFFFLVVIWSCDKYPGPYHDVDKGLLVLYHLVAEKHIHQLDCIAVDGGYTQYIKKVVEDTDLSKKNFCYPICKSCGKDLAQDEANYNKIFGSFWSQIEATFGELGAIFEKHNNRTPVLVTKIATYNLQVSNVKKMVAMLALEAYPIHSAWMRDGFDFP